MPEEFRVSVGGPSDDVERIAIDIGKTDGIGAAPEPNGKPRKLRKDGQPWGSGAGRKSASGTGAQKAKAQVDLSTLTGLFVGLHVTLSTQFQIPELAMEMSEGEQFMKSAQNVMRHYSVETTQKTLDWVAFMGTIAQIYGTRFGAYMIRKNVAEKPRATIYPMPVREPPKPSGSQPATQSAPLSPQFGEDAIIHTPDFEPE